MTHVTKKKPGTIRFDSLTELRAMRPGECLTLRRNATSLSLVRCGDDAGTAFIRWLLRHDGLPPVNPLWSENALGDFLELLQHDITVSGPWQLKSP